MLRFTEFWPGLEGVRISQGTADYAAGSCTKKDDPSRVHETLGISHAHPNRLNQ
jgi:hypothetical protein